MPSKPSLEYYLKYLHFRSWLSCSVCEEYIISQPFSFSIIGDNPSCLLQFSTAFNQKRPDPPVSVLLYRTRQSAMSPYLNLHGTGRHDTALSLHEIVSSRCEVSFPYEGQPLLYGPSAPPKDSNCTTVYSPQDIPRPVSPTSILDSSGDIHQPIPFEQEESDNPSIREGKGFRTNEELFGYALLAAASLCFACNVICVRTSESRFNVPPTSVVFILGVTQFVMSMGYLLCFTSIRQIARSLTKKQFWLITLRGVFGGLTVLCLYSSFKLIPSGDADAIFFIGPALTIFFSAIYLSEPVTMPDVLAALLSIFGAILISRPDSSSGSAMKDATALTTRIVGCSLAAAAAVLSSLSYVIIRSVVTSSHYMLPLVSLGFYTVILTAACGRAVSLTDVLANPVGHFFAFACAVFSVLGQSLVQLGLRHSPCGTGCLVRNIEVPLVFGLAIVTLHETPTWLGAFGSILVVLSAVVIGARHMMKQH